MQVRLIRKLADSVDGIDLSRYGVGDVFEVSTAEGERLIAERWAIPVNPEPPLVAAPDRRGANARPGICDAAPPVERRAPRTPERLREIRKELEERSSDEQQRRRAEDRIRQEHQDSRAKTYPPESA